MANAKLERLLDLVAELLHTRRPLTADQLHERLPGYPEEKASFKRAFERDKADLREMGIPIRIETVPGTHPPEDGYRIDPDEYYLADPGLEPDELAAVHLAANAVRLDGSSTAAALRKLGGAVGDAAGDDPAAVATLPGSPHLAATFEAIGARRRLRFRYGDTDRVVDPLRLHHERGRWYLRAHDHGAGDLRTFRLDRVDGAIHADEPDTAASADPGPIVLDPWVIGDDEPVTARVRIAGPQARLAARIAGEGVVATWEGDAVVLELPVRNRDGFRSFVLGFLDDATVLGPDELRADLDAWLQELAD